MLTDTEKKLLRDSWRLVVPIMDTAADLFYRRLFELQPAYRRLFSDDMQAQKRKLMATLAFVVKSTDWQIQQWEQEVAQSDDVFMVVLALGRRHALLYKVPDDAYPVVGEALLWTLDMGLGEAFTPEVRAVWAKLYGLLSSIMVMGGKHATGDGTASGAVK